MSLINCPECGNECSPTAVSCPNCGHPFVKPVVQPKVIVRETPRQESFPKWIFIPLALLGAVILFVIFTMLNRDDTAEQRNINVNIERSRQPERVQTTTSNLSTTTEPSTITSVPSTSQPSTVTVPQSMEQPSTVTSVPSGSGSTIVETAPDKGAVKIEAKILAKNGSSQPVTKEKFYLLDKDLESILSEARIDDTAGQGLINAFGLSVVNPGKYGDTNQKALAAIKRHIVYSTTTDSTGKGEIKDVKPKSYYLFGIAKTRNGFAIWSSPVSINPGDNSLLLDPVTPTEIVDYNQ